MKKFLLLLLLLSSFIVAQDSLKHKIGQMLMVGFLQDSESFDSLIIDLQEYNLGGVLLFAHNVESPEDVKELTGELYGYAETPLFIATDQEGGLVARLDEQNGWIKTPSAYQLGSVFDMEDSTRALGALMANWLSDAGINFNLAPVVDVNVNPESPAIGNYGRSFSDDPAVVAEHAGWFINEFHKKNIITATKHYPGHGSAMDDSHNGFTDISNTWSEAELIPYELMIEDDYTDFVMTGHLFNNNMDDTYPASISDKSINGWLKDTLGFNGLVISDEMLMGAIANNYGFEEALKLAVNAGTDVLLYRTNLDEDGSLVRKVINTIYDGVQAGEIEETTIDAAYNNIMRIKNERLATFIEDDQVSKLTPTSFELGNYPNPFNPSTKIRVNIRSAGNYTIAVYSALGERVKELASGDLQSGVHEFNFNGTGLASGVYIVTLTGSNQFASHKIMLMK